MASDFGSMFGADAGDFNFSGEAKSAFDQSFKVVIDALKNSSSQFKDTANQIKAIAEMEKLRREAAAKGIKSLQEYIKYQTKYVQDLKKSNMSLKDLNTTLKMLKTSIDKDVKPKIKELKNDQVSMSKEFSKAAVAAGNGIINTFDQMYSTAGNIVSAYRFWYTEMPKKVSVAFRHMADLAAAWSSNSKNNQQYKATLLEYKKFLKETKTSTTKITSDTSKVLKKFSADSKKSISDFANAAKEFIKWIKEIKKELKGEKTSGSRAAKTKGSAPGVTPPGGGPPPGGGNQEGGEASRERKGGRIGNIMSKIAGIGSAVSGAIGGILSVFVNNLELKINRGMLALETKLGRFEDLASQGIFSDTAAKTYGGIQSEILGERSNITGRAEGKIIKTGFYTYGRALDEGTTEVINRMRSSFDRLVVATRTYFSDKQFGDLVENFARRMSKSGDDVSKQIDPLLDKIIGKHGFGGMVSVLSKAAKSQGFNPKVATDALVDLQDTLLEVNESITTGGGLIHSLIEAGDTFKKFGIDIKKSAGALTKEFIGSVKKWDSGLKTFLAMSAYGGDPFSAYRRAAQGGPGHVSAMMGSVFKYLDRLTANLDENKAYKMKELFAMDFLKFSPELAAAFAANSDAFRNDPKKFEEAMKKAQDEANPNRNLALLKDYGERMLEIQEAQFDLQEKMLDIAFAGLFLLYGIGKTAQLILEELMNGFKYIGRVLVNIWDSEGRKAAAQAYDDVSAALKKEKDVYTTMVSENFKSLVDGISNLKNTLETVEKTVSTSVDGLGKGSGVAATAIDRLKTAMQAADEARKVKEKAQESYEKRLKKAEGTNSDLKELAGKISSNTSSKDKNNKNKKSEKKPKEKHFGGMLEKFHYGGIIKQGNEALLMTPNPTAVLSPSDTRQAVRGSKEKHIHIHFNAPVYGIPKFEEMVNRIVMKAATGIR